MKRLAAVVAGALLGLAITAGLICFAARWGDCAMAEWLT